MTGGAAERPFYLTANEWEMMEDNKEATGCSGCTSMTGPATALCFLGRKGTYRIGYCWNRSAYGQHGSYLIRRCLAFRHFKIIWCIKSGHHNKRQIRI